MLNRRDCSIKTGQETTIGVEMVTEQMELHTG